MKYISGFFLFVAGLFVAWLKLRELSVVRKAVSKQHRHQAQDNQEAARDANEQALAHIERARALAVKNKQIEEDLAESGHDRLAKALKRAGARDVR